MASDYTPSSASDFLSKVLRMTPEGGIGSTSDPRVELFPTVGFPIARGSAWRILVQGRISKDAPLTLGKRLMLSGLIRALDISEEVAKSTLFQSRIRGFIAAPIKRSRVQVSIGDQTYILPKKSKSSGLFMCRLDLPRSHLSEYRSYGTSLSSCVALQPECKMNWDIGLGHVESTVFLAQPRGVSVVSDIDDTIKVTDVCNRRRMLLRTFAEPFTSIDGMSEVYQSWAQQGALFHYVSSSPWQIYDAISDFINNNGFPSGSLHLKWFRLRDEIFKKWGILRRKSKLGVIRGLIRRLPNRTFILVGDSGERDPEMYAKLVSKYPKQITRICIRQIDANPLDSKRLAKIYLRYGLTVPIQVFSHPEQLGNLSLV